MFLWILFCIVIPLSWLGFKISRQITCSCFKKCYSHLILIFYFYFSWLLHFIFRHWKVPSVSFLWDWVFSPCCLKLFMRNNWVIYTSCIGLLGQLIIKFQSIFDHFSAQFYFILIRIIKILNTRHFFYRICFIFLF